MPKRSDWTTRPLEDELGEALRAELLGWPEVAIRPMMGCMAFVRRKQMLGCYVNRALSKTKPRWMNRPGEPPLVWVRLSPEQAERARKSDGVAAARMGAKNWIEIALETRTELAEAVRWLGIAYEKPPAGNRRGKKSARPRRKRLS